MAGNYKVGDYKVCIDEATAFLDIAKLCSNDIGELLSEKMYPFAVNASFSCELFIKAIMIKRSPTNEFQCEHKLDKLFETLDEKDRQAIEAFYSAKCNSPLYNLLAESSNAFIKWRYALEEGVSINASAIIAFAEALQEYNKTLE